MTDKLNPDEAWDTSRFQKDNVTRYEAAPELTRGAAAQIQMGASFGDSCLPVPPPTHVLYTGPKQWQNLPPGSLFLDDEGQWNDNEKLPVSAVPGDNHHFAIPINVSLPAQTTPVCEQDILEEARDLIRGDRASSYGDAKASFARIASLWSTYKGVEITAKDVAAMMILLKVSRGVTSAKRDNWVDIIGYAALGSEIEKTE